MKLTSVFYLLTSNHHLYLSPAWDSAAWNTNAIRSWSLFWKTHTHLAKPYLTHWHLDGSWDSLAINAWLVPSRVPSTPPSVLEYVGTWVGIGSQGLEWPRLAFSTDSRCTIGQVNGSFFFHLIFNHLTSTRLQELILKFRPLQKGHQIGRPCPFSEGNLPYKLDVYLSRAFLCRQADKNPYLSKSDGAAVSHKWGQT